MGLGKQRGVACAKAGADLPVFAGARPGRNMIQDDARGLAGLARPVGVPRGHEVVLAAQDDAVIEHLETVGGKRGPRRRDIDDHFGRPCLLYTSDAADE